jgi:5-oxoprolinase (ATP-hydrolysing) subunit A
MSRIDLNADVGEGFEDAPLFPLLSSINVSCGAHAGSEEVMARTVSEALPWRLAIGAHPGYPDRENFGRRPLALPLEEIEALVRDQIRELARVAAELGARLSHVKPHGALYNQAAADPALARAVARAVRETSPQLRLYGLAGSQSLEASRQEGLVAVAEGFADRRYKSDGTLAPRTLKGAVIDEPAAAAAQALAIASGRAVKSIDGSPVLVRAQTLCLHGDSPHALETALAVRRKLEQAGIEISAPAIDETHTRRRR